MKIVKMQRETRISYDAYFDVTTALEPRWRIVQVGEVYCLQYKNRKVNGWGREPRGNESPSLDKIMELYQTRVRQRDWKEKLKIRKEMEEIHLEGYYRQQMARYFLKPRKANLIEAYVKLI
jgi:hypothetical protein